MAQEIIWKFDALTIRGLTVLFHPPNFHILLESVIFDRQKTHASRSKPGNMHIECATSCFHWSPETFLSQIRISCHDKRCTSGHQVSAFAARGKVSDKEFFGISNHIVCQLTPSKCMDQFTTNFY